LERRATGGAPGWALGLALLVLVLDQVTKALIRRTLALHEERVLVPGFLSLKHGENRGLAFGLLSDAPLPFQAALLTTLALVLVAGLLLFWNRVATSVPAHAALGLILGGAIGNVADRLRGGAVTDFIHVFWRTHTWPDFNVADSAICVAIVLLLWDSLWGSGKAAPSD
jgi:signal peptidase II